MPVCLIFVLSASTIYPCCEVIPIPAASKSKRGARNHGGCGPRQPTPSSDTQSPASDPRSQSPHAMRCHRADEFNAPCESGILPLDRLRHLDLLRKSEASTPSATVHSTRNQPRKCRQCWGLQASENCRSHPGHLTLENPLAPLLFRILLVTRQDIHRR